jgi:hypothetical protein
MSKFNVKHQIVCTVNTIVEANSIEAAQIQGAEAAVRAVTPAYYGNNLQIDVQSTEPLSAKQLPDAEKRKYTAHFEQRFSAVGTIEVEAENRDQAEVTAWEIFDRNPDIFGEPQSEDEVDLYEIVEEYNGA